MSEQPQPSVNLRGAVDLSSLAAPPPPAPSAETPAGLIVDVTEATLNDIVQRSMTVPVVALLWQVGEGNSVRIGATMEQLVREYGGKFLLARIDVAAHPQIAQVFQIQSVPAAVALLKGQPIPLFQGAPGKEQVSQVIDQVLEAAAGNGVTGTVEVEGEVEAPAEPELPPHLKAAYEAIGRDDLASAEDAFSQALKENPKDADAAAGLAQVQLMQRIAGLDAQSALAKADADATDTEAQLQAADIEVAAGQFEQGFDRLIARIRSTAGDEKEQLRQRLISLFLLAPSDDPAVAKARRNLALALF